MKPEGQRIAIAEACGWLRMNRIGKEVYYDPEGGHVFPHELPNYLNDLNAMHEAEKFLTSEQEESYVHHLGSLIMSDVYEDSDIRYQNSNLSSFDSAYRATATQRAEAFLKTIGKWKQG